MFQEQMAKIKKRLVENATLIETMIRDSMQGLLEKDSELLKKVMSEDEPKANHFELELDELCTASIAIYQPKAKDLRTTLMVLRMTNDLERMGDLAVNICESGSYLIERPPVKPLIDIPRMARETESMLKDSIDSFINEDANLARQVCERDGIVDGLRDQVLRELITFMTGDSGTIERSLALIRISRNLERIADLSTNICEDVIFMVEGRVIKHHRNSTEEGDSES